MNGHNFVLRGLTWLIVAMIALAFVFAIAAIFLPDFRDNGAGIIVVIFGGITGMATIVGGMLYMGGQIKGAAGREAGEKEEANGS